ncbi:MAG: hypothetical protein P8M78_04980 [Myxococcota bacterium]|nr:hypothetical protein [Myxococcota bacterium]
MKARLIALMAIALLAGCSDSHNSGSNGEEDDFDFVGVPQTCRGDSCTEGYVLYENASALQQWSCDEAGPQMTTCYCANPDTQRIGTSTADSIPITNGVAVQAPVTMTIPSLTAETVEFSEIVIALAPTVTCVPASGATVNYTRTQSSP